MAVNEGEIQEFVHKALTDLGGMLTATLVTIGDKLGLYRALRDGGPATPAELASRTFVEKLREQHDVIAYRFDRGETPIEIAAYPRKPTKAETDAALTPAMVQRLRALVVGLATRVMRGHFLFGWSIGAGGASRCQSRIQRGGGFLDGPAFALEFGCRRLQCFAFGIESRRFRVEIGAQTGTLLGAGRKADEGAFA